MNFMIIIIPVIIIIIFSLISIIYLTRFQKRKNNEISGKKKYKFKFCIKILLKYFKQNKKNTGFNTVKKNVKAYLPVIQTDVTITSSPSSLTSNFERPLNEYIHTKNDNLNCYDSRTKSNLSSTTSTYLIPQTVETNSTTETKVSPLIMYYKVFDSKNNFNNPENDFKMQKDDLTSVVSTITNNSRFYYQLNSDNDVI